MNWKRVTRDLVLPITAIALVHTLQAQTQSKVTVDGKDYTVTEFPGRSMHMVQLTDNQTQLSAMVSVQNGKITAYISPPGGGGQQDLINKVWKAYEAAKGGTAANSAAPAGGAAGQQTPAGTDDLAARRAQADAAVQAALQRAGQATTPVSAKPHTVKNLTADGAVVADPVLGDVTIGDNGMKFTWAITSDRAAPVYYTVSFKGGEQEAGEGKKILKGAKGLGTAIGNSMNTSAGAATSMTTKTDVWQEVTQSGKTKRLVYESGGFRTGAGITERDPMASRAVDDLYKLLQDLDLAKDAIAKAQQGGQQIAFDVTTDRFQRGYKALQDATSAYHPK